MTGIIDTLCNDPKELKRIASQRKLVYLLDSVKDDEVAVRERNGWEIVRRSKNTTSIKKQKPQDILLEDRVWMIFYRLGFSSLNKDRNCRLEFKSGYQKQIDVLARDDENIFVVECKSTERPQAVNARESLQELAGSRDDIQKAIRAEWGQDCGRINLLVVIGSTGKRDVDEQFVKDSAEKNLFLWCRAELEYIENLIAHLGTSAKYQLYSVIFAQKEAKNLGKSYYALQGKMGGQVFYSFLIPAKDLLKYAYIHHRKLTVIVDAVQAYQRMLKRGKLKQVARYIDQEDGYFPNTIIVNFSKQLQWQQQKSEGTTKIGKVTLPSYYGCAWVIDGQHRLYGAARAQRDVVVPVLAFERMDEAEQANLFVEINSRQTSVAGNLLWDLYSDIYRGATDPKQKIRYQISETAKIIARHGPLKGHIKIESMPGIEHGKLSLATVCDTIMKYSPWAHIGHPTDESKTPVNAARLINSYFEVLKSLWPEDWEKGSKGVLLSNNGFGVFMMVFDDVIAHMVYQKQDSLLQESKVKEFKGELEKKYLTPVIELLKDDRSRQEHIRKGVGRGPQSDNARELDRTIHVFVEGFSPRRLKDAQPPEGSKAQLSGIAALEEKAKSLEPKLRSLVLRELNQHYGEKWWKQGIPSGPKKRVDDSYQDELKRKPYLRREKDENERKFNLFGLGDLKEAIVNKDNWAIFERYFGDKDELEQRIRGVKALRDPASHTRKIDDQDVQDAVAGLLWFSRCLTDPDLNPYGIN